MICYIQRCLTIFRDGISAIPNCGVAFSWAWHLNSNIRLDLGFLIGLHELFEPLIYRAQNKTRNWSKSQNKAWEIGAKGPLSSERASSMGAWEGAWKIVGVGVLQSSVGVSCAPPVGSSLLVEEGFRQSCGKYVGCKREYRYRQWEQRCNEYRSRLFGWLRRFWK